MQEKLQEFRTDFNINHEVETYNDEDTLYITGVANTGEKDLAGDRITREALNEIATQIPRHNLHLDHGTQLSDILGPLVSGEVTSRGLEYKARILDEKRDFIESLLSQEVRLGSSLSGTCTYKPGSDEEITSWNLTEISLTGIPCDQGTMNTVGVDSKSFDAAIRMAKKYNGDKMELLEKENITADIPRTGNPPPSPDEADRDPPVVDEDTVIRIVNDAINEVKDELRETLLKELENHFVTREELLEVINGIKPEEKEEDDADVEPVKIEVDEAEKSVDNEDIGEDNMTEENNITQKAMEEPVIEEQVVEEPVIESAAPAAEEPAMEPAEPAEEPSEAEEEMNSTKAAMTADNTTIDMEEIISKKVDARIQEIFKNLNNKIDTKYHPDTRNAAEKAEPKTKNAYTPEELAKIL